MVAQRFLQHLQEVLRDNPAGLSEFDLIKQLEADGEPGFGRDCLKDNLSLFQTHFLLFHSLYQLGEQLAQDHGQRLKISALCIQLTPCSHMGGTELSSSDPLREYYLDLSNLEKTEAHDVEVLLDQFWQRFLHKDSRNSVCNDERIEALEILSLEDPVDWPTIKNKHRRLAMQHHPDRGGDEKRLQEINAAMRLLAQAHGK